MFRNLGSPLLLLASTIFGGSSHAAVPAGITSVHDFTMTDINGESIPLSSYRGKILLIVNVASKCGNTPQYKDLEALYGRYRDRGFMVLGFPANNFLGQEPGSDEEIKAFCTRTYGVTFDLFSKISVKGKDQHPLYTYLTSAEANPETAGEVKWNFQKYLVGRDGKVLAKFAPGTKPLAEEVTGAIERALEAR
jgi:glutathione peroxidase